MIFLPKRTSPPAALHQPAELGAGLWPFGAGSALTPAQRRGVTQLCLLSPSSSGRSEGGWSSRTGPELKFLSLWPSAALAGHDEEAEEQPQSSAEHCQEPGHRRVPAAGTTEPEETRGASYSCAPGAHSRTHLLCPDPCQTLHGGQQPHMALPKQLLASSILFIRPPPSHLHFHLYS